MQLHMFQFDEELKSVRGFGAPIDLLPFYNAGVSITHACFVHGNEEILLVDSNARTGEGLLSDHAAAQVYLILPLLFLTPC
jgi:hypothetical protein